MLEPTKDSVLAACSPRHTAITAPPSPPDKLDPPAYSVQVVFIFPHLKGLKHQHLNALMLNSLFCWRSFLPASWTGPAVALPALRMVCPLAEPHTSGAGSRLPARPYMVATKTPKNKNWLTSPSLQFMSTEIMLLSADQKMRFKVRQM